METTTRRSTARTRLSAGAFVASTVYVFLALGLVTWVVLPTVLLGLRPTVITSGSMAPLIAPGDIVMYEPAAPEDELEGGTVVTFHDPVFDRLVTHRVVERTGDGYVTRGDATGETDPRPVRPDEVQGRGRLLVPFVGLPLVWMRRGAWLILAIWFGLSVLAARSAFPGTPVQTDPAEPAPGPPPGRTERATRSLGLTQLFTLGTAAALLLAIPSSNAAFGAASANTGSAFQVGTWAIATPQTYIAQADGSWTTSTPPAGVETSLRLDPGTFAMVPVVTTSVDATFAGDTTLEVWVRRRGQPGPRTLHVALDWGSDVVSATYTATPGNQPEPWTITLPTAGKVLPAGTAISLVYELDSTSIDRLDIWYGGAATPTALTFPDAVS